MDKPMIDVIPESVRTLDAAETAAAHGCLDALMTLTPAQTRRVLTSLMAGDIHQAWRSGEDFAAVVDATAASLVLTAMALAEGAMQPVTQRVLQ